MLPVSNRQGGTLVGSSTNQANGAAVATLTPAADKFAHLGSIQARALGATAFLASSITVTGIEGGTLTIPFYYPAGVAVEAVPANIVFPVPLRGAGPGTPIVCTLGASGAGGTNAAIAAEGFQF
jgi:hypothetical protein